MLEALKRLFDLEKKTIECNQCQSMIDSTYVFCPKCQHPTENYGKPIDYKKKFSQLLIIYGGMFIVVSSFYYMSSNLGLKIYKIEKVKNEQQNATYQCAGFGTESCIDKVRLNFENTNKTILGEEYLGNGQFGFTFIDRNHPGAFTAKINTDCNCTITNVQVSIIR